MKKTTKRRAVPAARSREPMTKKARAAIHQYVRIRIEKAPLVDAAVHWTLQAERMRRTELYAWLDAKGYRWKARYGWYQVQPKEQKA